METVLWNLRRHGIERVVLSTGYLADKIEEVLEDGSRFGLELKYCVETEPLGTGGAAKFAASLLEDEFLMLNGDTLYDVNYLALLNLKTAPGNAAIALRHVPDVSRYGGCELEEDRITAFQEKLAAGPGYINAGVYALDQTLLARLPDGPSSIERDLFSVLAAEGRLTGLRSEGFFVDIGLPESLAEAQTTVPAWRRKPAAFLDRDGVLNRNTHHTYRTKDLEWLEGSKEAVRWLNDAGYLVIVVTNQAGIGKGIYTEADFHHFMDQMRADLSEMGGHFDDVYFCPYHPTEGIGEYLLDSPDRKPNPGMILRAIEDWGIDTERSFLIGDAETDLMAAERAGIRGIRYEPGDHLLQIAKAATGSEFLN